MVDDLISMIVACTAGINILVQCSNTKTTNILSPGNYQLYAGADPGGGFEELKPPLLKNYLCIASLRLQQFCHQPCYLCICM